MIISIMSNLPTANFDMSENHVKHASMILIGECTTDMIPHQL
jgi:hypothetical protein